MERRNGTEKNSSEKCFALGRARDLGRETMLDVRLEGEAFALPYAHLSLIKRDGERAITLSFASHLVKIEGERLRPLYEALTEHAVRFVAAAEQALPRERTAAPGEPVITSLELVPLGQGSDALL